MSMNVLSHLSPPWLFVAPAVVFAWGCALEKFAVGLDRLLAVGVRAEGEHQDVDEDR